MTDKLHCPFCGAELEDDIFYARRKFYSCVNPKCKINDWGGCSEQILQALIAGKKAQNALNKIWHSPNEKPEPCTIITEDGEWIWDVNGHYQGDRHWKNNTPWAYLQDVVDLMTIASITKQEK